eukprot:scaffold8403_cov420-Pinguiococcus_pyrenoidosus.AAC.2
MPFKNAIAGADLLIASPSEENAQERHFKLCEACFYHVQNDPPMQVCLGPALELSKLQDPAKRLRSSRHPPTARATKAALRSLPGVRGTP